MLELHCSPTTDSTTESTCTIYTIAQSVLQTVCTTSVHNVLYIYGVTAVVFSYQMLRSTAFFREFSLLMVLNWRVGPPF